MKDFPQRKKLPHTGPNWISNFDSVFFITINCTPPGNPQLCHPSGHQDKTARNILSAAQFYHTMPEPKWFIHLFLLMPDHLHAILSFPPGTDLRATIKAWKGYVRRNFNIEWQSDFFDHRLRTPKSHADKASYIRQNPVRKGYCKSPEEWPHAISFDPISGRETAIPEIDN